MGNFNVDPFSVKTRLIIDEEALGHKLKWGILINAIPIVPNVDLTFGSFSPVNMALLDTGSAFSIFPSDWAIHNGINFANLKANIPLNCRFGTLKGSKIACKFTIVCDEDGEELSWVGDVWVSDSWNYPPVIGIEGILEKMRIHIDPLQESVMFALN